MTSDIVRRDQYIPWMMRPYFEVGRMPYTGTLQKLPESSTILRSIPTRSWYKTRAPLLLLCAGLLPEMAYAYGVLGRNQGLQTVRADFTGMIAS
jgi:hypothetical protein